MPELPEVETIAAYLRLGRDGIPSLIGKRIHGARLLWERTLAAPTPQSFLQRIPGQEIRQIDRRGKFLRFHLSPDVLLIHLRMSGDLWIEAVDAPLAPHHRLVLDFQDGTRLAFNDARKFGRVWLTASPDEVLGDLGPEPFDPQLTAPLFHQKLLTHRRQLKPLLLDQSFLAGLGNIYTDEALNLAKLHPLTLSQTLTLDQAGSLLESIRAVLTEGIRRSGASIDWVYRGGDFQNFFRVYQRTDQPCPACQTPIQRMVVGQRGTHFCPHCQPAPA